MIKCTADTQHKIPTKTKVVFLKKIIMRGLEKGLSR